MHSNWTGFWYSSAGYLHFVLDLGTGILKVKVSADRVDNGQRHRVSISHEGVRGVVTLDSVERRYVISGSTEERFQLEGGLVAGGMASPDEVDRFPLEFWSARLAPGFVGCMEDLTMNGERVQLVRLARDQEVLGLDELCREGEPWCPRYLCLHGGICREGWNRFNCDCSATPFTGDTCRIGKWSMFSL